jgi:hypothetical protein
MEQDNSIITLILDPLFTVTIAKGDGDCGLTSIIAGFYGDVLKINEIDDDTKTTFRRLFVGFIKDQLTTNHIMKLDLEHHFITFGFSLDEGLAILLNNASTYEPSPEREVAKIADVYLKYMVSFLSINNITVICFAKEDNSIYKILRFNNNKQNNGQTIYLLHTQQSILITDGGHYDLLIPKTDITDFETKLDSVFISLLPEQIYNHYPPSVEVDEKADDVVDLPIPVVKNFLVFPQSIIHTQSVETQTIQDNSEQLFSDAFNVDLCLMRIMSSKINSGDLKYLIENLQTLQAAKVAEDNDHSEVQPQPFRSKKLTAALMRQGF